MKLGSLLEKDFYFFFEKFRKNVKNKLNRKIQTRYL
jgi:hypothetical protein